MKSRILKFLQSQVTSLSARDNINRKEAQISINLPTDFEEYLKDTFKVVSERLSIEITVPENKGKGYWSASFRYLSIRTNNKLLTKDLRHRNFKNVFVCSGAVIPESSYSNTGLTIIALALKLSDYLTNKI